MITSASLVLNAIIQAFLDALAGEITDELRTKLQKDPVRNTLKQALGAAILHYERYIEKSWRLALVSPLYDGLLTQPNVVEELAQVVRFEREPDYTLIGRCWRDYIDSPPPWCDFSDEAKRFVTFFREELRGTEAFYPVFMQKTLSAIATSSASSAESLAAIEGRLADISSLLSSSFKTLAQHFFQAPSNARDEIKDYSEYIADKTRNFIGRDFIFDQIKAFTEQQSRGYFCVWGDPGAGKTSFAAQLVKTQGLVHHFNIRSMGIKFTHLFLKNICAQLIARYIPEHSLPIEKDFKDGSFLLTLLQEVARLHAKEKIIIVIDALDEVDDDSFVSRTNVLYLPDTNFLPENIYFVVTVRQGAPVKLPEHHRLDIDPKSPKNKADIRKYIAQTLTFPGIQAYISAQKISDEYFVGHLEDKSEGNFIYLHYILRDIANGIYNDLKFESLPHGLQRYYEDHWVRMRGIDDEAWFEYKLPVLMALAAAEAPVTIRMIQDFSGVQDSARIARLMQNDRWGQFLHDKKEVQSNSQIYYSIYHASFRDFLKKKEEIKEAGVNFMNAKRRINAFYHSKVIRRPRAN